MRGLSPALHSGLYPFFPSPILSFFSLPVSIQCFSSAEELFNLRPCKPQRGNSLADFVRRHYIFIDLQGNHLIQWNQVLFSLSLSAFSFSKKDTQCALRGEEGKAASTGATGILKRGPEPHTFPPLPVSETTVYSFSFTLISCTTASTPS